MPKTIGSNLVCGGFTSVSDGDNYEVVEYKIEPTSIQSTGIEILPYEFNSIFAFICTFDSAEEVDILKSGFITAELPRYIFRIEQKKDIPVTPPLGIVFEPFQQQCGKCGKGSAENLLEVVQGAADRCTVHECHQITTALGDPSDSKRTCYFEHAGKTITSFAGNPCKVCGGTQDACEKFLAEKSCEEARDLCRFSCKWVPGVHEVSGVTLSGKCVKATPTIGSFSCTTYNRYNTIISSAVVSSGLSALLANTDYKDGNAVVAALISRESAWNERASRYESRHGDSSYGLMQVIPKFHPECDTAKIRAYDAAESIRCGVNLLAANLRECDSVEGALRKYNSGNCNGRTFDPNYVDDILGRSGFGGGYAFWVACETPTTTTGGPLSTVPAINYISQTDYNKILAVAPGRNSGTKIEYVVLHHSVETSVEDVLKKNVESENNEHYIVAKDGTIVSVVPEHLSAQHANCLNSRSIGIEIVNRGDGSDPYPPQQVASLKTLVADLIRRHNIQPGRIIGHGCTSDDKKPDEPTGLDPNFFGVGWTVAKRSGSPVTCVNLCAPRVTQKGDPDYCAKKIAGQVHGVGADICYEGEGGCKSTSECELVGVGNPPQKLSCRIGVVPGIGICCFPQDSNEYCLSRFNAWKQI